MKQDTVQAQKAILLAAQDSALEAGLGACYDQGAVDQKASDGTLTQADIDAAVAQALAEAKIASDAALAELAATDAQTLAAEHEKAVADLAAVQTALDAMTAKEQLEEAAVADVQSSILKVQAAFDAIKALLLPPVV